MNSAFYKRTFRTTLVLAALALALMPVTAWAQDGDSDPWENAICGSKAQMPEGCQDKYSECFGDPWECAKKCGQEFEVLSSYLTKKGTPAGQPVLAFDHVRRIWVSGKAAKRQRTEKHNGKEETKAITVLEPGSEAVDFDANCVPTLGMRRKIADKKADNKTAKKTAKKPAEVKILVFNSNPLLYTTEPKAVEEYDPEGLEQLQELAGLLGGALGTLVDPPDVTSEALEDDLPDWIVRLTAESRKRNTEAKVLSEKLSEGVDPLNKELKEAALAGAKVRSSQRDVEANRQPEPVANFGTAASTIDRSTVTLMEKLQELDGLKAPTCTSGYTAAAAAIVHWQLGKPGTGAATFKANLIRLRDVEALELAKCSPAERISFPELADHVETIDYVEPTDGETTDPPSDAEKLEQTILVFRKLASGYTARAAGYSAARKLADGVPAKAPAASKVMASLEAWQKRWKKTVESCGRPDVEQWRCLATGVQPVFEGNPRLKWDKGQKRAFTIEADATAPFAADIALRRAKKIETEVKLHGRWFDKLGVGVAMTMTGIKDPTFGARAVPCEAADDGVVPACTPAQPAPPALRPDPTTLTKEMRIARSSEESRDGDLALLLSYRFSPKRQKVGWGVEAGFGLGDDFAGFAGLSLYLGKYVRFGGGYTSQKVTDHAGGQDIGTVVASADSIRTREKDVSDTYFSLTIALDSLPIFDSDGD